MWEQELYKGFVYTQDRPFFHTFQADVRDQKTLKVFKIKTLTTLYESLTFIYMSHS